MRPNCDPVGGHSRHRCDPLRPRWPHPRRPQPEVEHSPAAAVGDGSRLRQAGRRPARSRCAP
jgi:hypothetical protein